MSLQLVQGVSFKGFCLKGTKGTTSKNGTAPATVNNVFDGLKELQNPDCGPLEVNQPAGKKQSEFISEYTTSVRNVAVTAIPIWR